MVSYHNLDMLRADVGFSMSRFRRHVRTSSRSAPGDPTGSQRDLVVAGSISCLYNLSVVSVACWLQVMSIAFRMGFCIVLNYQYFGCKMLQVVSIISLWPSFCRFSISALDQLPFPSNITGHFFKYDIWYIFHSPP